MECIYYRRGVCVPYPRACAATFRSATRPSYAALRSLSSCARSTEDGCTVGTSRSGRPAVDLPLQHGPAHLAHPERRPQQRLPGRGAEHHDQLRLHQRQFGRQPGAAGRHLPEARRLVDAALAGLGPGELEVLDRVGHIGIGGVDTGLFERPVEQLARRADEGPAPAVLLVTGLLPHQHDAGLGASGAEDRLGGGPVERAATAVSGGSAEGFQVGALGDEGRRRVGVLGGSGGRHAARVPAVGGRKSQTRIGCGDSRRAGSGPSYSRMIS